MTQAWVTPQNANITYAAIIIMGFSNWTFVLTFLMANKGPMRPTVYVGTLCVYVNNDSSMSSDTYKTMQSIHIQMGSTVLKLEVLNWDN
jgi:hypothetical protein